MMGAEAPGTCRATHKLQVINLESCWILLVNLFELSFGNLLPSDHIFFISFSMLRRYYFKIQLNPLNAELNPICHLLVLLRDLTFMGPCIVSIFQYTGCPRRKEQNFGRVFLMLKYTDITQNTYIQSWTVTEIMAREKCGRLAVVRTIPVSWP